MEIPPALQQLLKQPSPTATNEAQHLRFAQDSAKPGTIIKAQVAQSMALSDAARAKVQTWLTNAEQRATPLLQAQANSTQLDTSMPAKSLFDHLTKAEGNPVKDPIFKQLKNTAELFYTRLDVRGKTFATLTSQQLPQGNIVTLQKRSDGQWQQLPAGQTSTSAVTTDNNQRLNTRIGTQQTQEIVSDALRRYLPKGADLASIAKAAEKLQHALGFTTRSSTPLPPQQQTLRDILAGIQHSALPANENPNASEIKTWLNNSGGQLESKLRAAAEQMRQQLSQPSKTANKHSPQNSPPSANVLSSKQLASLWLTQQNLTPARQMRSSHQVFHDPNTRAALNLPASDVKHLLLKLLNFAEGSDSQKPSQTSFSSTQLTQIIQQLSSGLSTQLLKNRSITELQQIAAQQLRQLAYSGIARITTQQLKPLLSHAAEHSVAGGGLQTELSVRLGDNYYPVVIQIESRNEQHGEQGKPQSEDEKRARERETGSRWKVYLEFDLEELGTFASDISFCEGQLSTKFWVTDVRFWKTCCRQLEAFKQQLCEAGLQIEDMQCLNSSPPEKTPHMQHALVDIRT